MLSFWDFGPDVFKAATKSFHFFLKSIEMINEIKKTESKFINYYNYFWTFGQNMLDKNKDLEALMELTETDTESCYLKIAVLKSENFKEQ